MGTRLAAQIIVLLSVILAISLGFAIVRAFGHNNGRWVSADPATSQWFNGLKSHQGLCCSFADGWRIDDADWRQTNNPEMPFQVRVEGQWVDVPKGSVVTDPNRVGYAIVWPTKGADGKIGIRCFIAGIQT